MMTGRPVAAECEYEENYWISISMFEEIKYALPCQNHQIAEV